jgi:COP9 signalosome complex subunit 4
MIGQGRSVEHFAVVLELTDRLRAWVDQPTRCLHFESHSNTDQAEAKGSAGGLHIEEKEIDIEPITWTERWDNRIRYTSLQVRSCILGRGLS